MAEEKSEPSSFRVVDRRTFTADGTRREGASTEEEKKRERGPQSPPSPPSAPGAEAEPEEFPGETPGGFETLVSYLSTTAMFQLGLLAGPSGERIPADLVNARRTIDLLDVLQQKTRGNLTPEESRLLEDVLYELRMSFVEVEKRQAKRTR